MTQLRLDIKTISAIATFTLSTLCSVNVSGATTNEESCSWEPASCIPEERRNPYCLGPRSLQANAPVYPLTCDGDWVVKFASIYWKAQQEGLEYSFLNEVVGSEGTTNNAKLNILVDSQFLSPGFSWDQGFKLGVGCTTALDGWNFEVMWTHLSNSAQNDVQSKFSENEAILPIWTAYQSDYPGNHPVLFATNAATFWKLSLDLIDLELGRLFWAGHRLAIRPYIGLRYANLDQHYEISLQGGTWEVAGNPDKTLKNKTELENNFQGLGLRSGLDSIWSIGCGWGFYGQLATSIIYGHFSLDHQEEIQLLESPFTKTKFCDTEESFRASRAVLDMGLGVQWSGLVYDCQYGITISLGWEHVAFFHQNQLWRITRIGGSNSTKLVNNEGQNVFSQSQGTLTTSGIVFKGSFAF